MSARAKSRQAENLDLEPETLAVVAGRDDGPGAPAGTDVSFTSTYRAGGDITYGRDGNQTWAALESVIGALEGGRALAFASGLAAIAAVLEDLAVGARVVVAAGAYNGTRRLLGDLAARGRLVVETVDVVDTEAVAAACPGADLLWLESPTNPLLEIADIGAACAAAHESGALVAVDNTIATPLLQRPLELGADVVVHSVTKLLAGHSDVVLGALATADPVLLALRASAHRSMHERYLLRRTLHGAIPGPMEAFLALRGIRSLPARLDRAQASAGELARRLAGHAGVSRVRYPGLPDDLGHELARKQMRGFGTIVSFEVTGGPAAADSVCEKVRLCFAGTSLGGVETLIERRGKYAGEELVPPALLRLSVGQEAVEDLWRDLENALG